MKLILEFLPIIIFFMVYKFIGLYPATACMMGISALQVVYSRIKTGQFVKMPLINLGLVSLLGGMTLYLQNDLFIKWKPSILYWLMGLIALLSHLRDKTLIQQLAEQNIQLPKAIWQKVNCVTGIFFIGLGCLNLAILTWCSTDTWVNFKLFGILGLTLVYFVLLGWYLKPYLVEQNID